MILGLLLMVRRGRKAGEGARLLCPCCMCPTHVLRAHGRCHGLTHIRQGDAIGNPPGQTVKKYNSQASDSMRKCLGAFGPN
jgi:hypothetical protein